MRTHAVDMANPQHISYAGHHALRKGRASLAHHIYLVTAVTHERKPVFADSRAAHIACRCFHDEIRLTTARLLAWVLMPDHAHWMLQLGEGETLPDVVARLKSVSSHEVNRKLKRQGKLWAHAYHDRALRHDDDMLAAARYIVANPLRAGLVRRIGDYPWWNAIWL